VLRLICLLQKPNGLCRSASWGQALRHVMHTGDAVPIVQLNAPAREVIMEMTRKRLA
jgi:hypothetical protein